MKKLIGGVVIVSLLIWSIAVLFLSQQNPTPPAWTAEPDDTPAAPRAQAEPAVRYPIPKNKELEDLELALKPVPPLNESDKFVADVLSGLIGSKSFRRLFRVDQIVRNIVVTIDNAPRQTMAARQLPIKPASGLFLVTRTGDNLSIAAKNAERYAPYIRLAENVNTKKLVAVYVHLYPLFQRAYQELGYPKGYFNDRLVTVIDHLLDAPEIEGPIALVQPHVVYQFTDSRLEAESAGHKAMIRIGNQNAAKVKAKLREIRQELTGQISQK